MHITGTAQQLAELEQMLKDLPAIDEAKVAAISPRLRTGYVQGRPPSTSRTSSCSSSRRSRRSTERVRLWIQSPVATLSRRCCRRNRPLSRLAGSARTRARPARRERCGGARIRDGGASGLRRRAAPCRRRAPRALPHAWTRPRMSRASSSARPGAIRAARSSRAGQTAPAARPLPRSQRPNGALVDGAHEARRNAARRAHGPLPGSPHVRPQGTYAPARSGSVLTTEA